MSYLARVRQLLAHQDNPMSRQDICAQFPAKKKTYVERAVTSGVSIGVFLETGNDQLVLNWSYLNRDLIQQHPARAPSPDA